MARRREAAERPIPAHPYRDTAIVYAVLTALLVLVAGLTGGSLSRAVVAGVGFFSIATVWTWWKFRVRIRERDAREAAPADPARAEDLPDREPPVGPTGGVVHGAVNGNGNGRVGGEQ